MVYMHAELLNLHYNVPDLRPDDPEVVASLQCEHIPDGADWLVQVGLHL